MKNNKKLLTVLLLVCLAFTLVTALASCDIFGGGTPSGCQHELTAVAEVKATCTEAGTKGHYTCSDCKKLFADAEGKTEIEAPEAINTLGHSFTNYASNDDATCTVDGTKTAKCDRCDEENTVADVDSKKGHSPADAVRENEVPASCGKDGSYESVVYCSVCEDEISRTEEVIAATGEHVYATEKERQGATCTDDGYVIMACKCGATKTETISRLGHKEAAAVMENEISATCTAEGSYDLVVRCSVCKTLISSEKKTTPMEEHSFTKYESDGNATCTEDGTKTAKCDGCDETKTVADKDSALDHSFTNYESDGNATCTEDGTKTAKCDRCDETKTVADEDSALDHSFTNYESDGNATCTEDGTKTAKCDRCDETKTVADEDSALDHSFTNYESDGNATCTADGTKTAKCDRCDETKTIADEGSALDHSFTNYESDGNATCTEDGTKTAKCDGCDETRTITDEGSMTDHTEAEAVKENVVNATCGANGSYDSVVKCSSCGTELSRTTVNVESTGEHVYATEQEKVAATCVAEGYVIMACGCGETEKTTLPIDENAHSWNEGVVTAPNCTEAGFTTYTCSVCGDNYTADEVDALGHKYEAVVTAPTCTEVGYTTYTCSACNDNYIGDNVAALGHTNKAAVVENIVGADLTTAGSYDVVIYCSVCDGEVSREKTVLPTLNITDYTTVTTVADGVVTTTFTYISDLVEYSASVTSDNYLTVNDGIYSQYDVAKLNSDTVTASYDEATGYTYNAKSAATLTNLTPVNADLIILGEATLNTDAAEWLIDGVSVTVGGKLTVSNSAANTVKITNNATMTVAKGGEVSVSGSGSVSVYIGIGNAADQIYDDSALIIDGTMTVTAHIYCWTDVSDDDGGEFGFAPAIYVRHGTLNATQIRTGSLQVGSLKDNAYGTLNVSDTIQMTQVAYSLRYVFANGELNATPNANNLNGVLYACTLSLSGSVIDIRKGMTITVNENGSNKYQYLINHEYRDRCYTDFIEEGATFNFPADESGKCGFIYGFMCARYVNHTHVYTYTSEPVTVMLDGVATEVLLLKVKNVTAEVGTTGNGHNDYQYVVQDYTTGITYPNVAANTSLTSGDDLLTSACHNGIWREATYTDAGGNIQTIYYQVVGGSFEYESLTEDEFKSQVACYGGTNAPSNLNRASIMFSIPMQVGTKITFIGDSAVYKYTVIRTNNPKDVKATGAYQFDPGWNTSWTDPNTFILSGGVTDYIVIVLARVDGKNFEVEEIASLHSMFKVEGNKAIATDSGKALTEEEYNRQAAHWGSVGDTAAMKTAQRISFSVKMSAGTKVEFVGDASVYNWSVTETNNTSAAAALENSGWIDGTEYTTQNDAYIVITICKDAGTALATSDIDLIHSLFEVTGDKC